MNANRTSLCLVLCIIGRMLFVNPTYGQSIAETYKITGIIADSSTQKPLEFITLNVLTTKKVTVKVDFTKPDGSFSFTNLKPDHYLLVVTGVGYQTKTVAVKLTDSLHTTYEVGTLYVQPQAIGLKEVSVKATKPIIRQETDRIAYDLQADPESKANNVLTMMRKVPFVSVDANDNLLVKGNSSFRVFIDGKPSSMAENNLKAVLQSMPASTLERIEVITNPPAKYDAEGLAGIINIVTVKKVGNGSKGTLSVNESFPVGGPGIGMTLAVKQGKLGWSMTGGASLLHSPTITYQNSRQTVGAMATELTQTGDKQSRSRTGYIGTELSYELSPRALLTGQFSLNGNYLEAESRQQSVLTGTAGVLQGYDLGNTNQGTSNGMDAGLNYQQGFRKDKNKLLTFSYRFLNFSTNRNSQLDLSNLVNYPQPDYQQNNGTKTGEHTVQVDYVRGLKALVIEAGAKAILRTSESDYRYLLYQEGTRQYESIPAFSNQFHYQQQVYSVYNAYQLKLKTWSLQTGVRAEATVIDADFVSSDVQIYPSYVNVVPSVSLTRMFGKETSLNVGYNQRIKRPGINKLNPFIDRSNPNFETAGNPELKPVVINNLQLTYVKSARLAVTLGLGYSFTRNVDMRLSLTDPATGITRSTYQNLGKASNIGLDFNLAYPLTKNWTISTNGTVSYLNISGQVGRTSLENRLLMHTITVSAGYKLPKGWRINAGLVSISQSATDLQSRTNGLVRTALSVNRELMAKKLNFSVVVSNPLTQYRNNILTTTGDNFSQTNTNQEYYRNVSLSLQYNFGALASALKKNARSIKNDDVSN